MPITAEELTGEPVAAEGPHMSVAPPPGENTSTDPEVTIVGWVDEVPKHRRTSPFDAVIDEIRRTGDTTRSAKIAWGDRPISPNKVNQMRKRYPDCDFSQVSVAGGRETYVRYTGQSTNA